MLKLIFENGEWKGFEAPEKPEKVEELHTKGGLHVYVGGDVFGHEKQLKKWEKAYAEARANAMKVLNPEIMDDFQFELTLPKHNDGVEGKGYDWPGSYEIKDK